MLAPGALLGPDAVTSLEFGAALFDDVTLVGDGALNRVLESLTPIFGKFCLYAAAVALKGKTWPGSAASAPTVKFVSAGCNQNIMKHTDTI